MPDYRYSNCSIIKAAVFLSLCAHGVAYGQSFDCSKAATPVEHRICASKSLRNMDSWLASALKKAISEAPDDRRELLKEERRWIAYRDKRCGHFSSDKRSEECLSEVYAARTEELSGGRFVLARKDPVCATLQAELLAQYPPQFEGTLDWKAASISLPPDLGNAVNEADFDFYNDGTISRVFRLEFAAYVLSGSALLVQPAPPSAVAGPSFGDPMVDPHTKFFPCQLANDKAQIEQCPPYGNDPTLQSFSVYGSKGTITQPVEQFPIRFTNLVPLRIHGTTFVVVSWTNRYPHTHSAVFRPNKEKKFDLVCLLRDPPPGT